LRFPSTSELPLPWTAERTIERVRQADIVVGIPAYNNERTISNVVTIVQAGLEKYFQQQSAMIVVADGGSTDGTPQALLRAQGDSSRLLSLETPLLPLHRVSLPYHGFPGKGSALRLIFQVAHRLSAKACVLVDPGLRSITPEWLDLLARPVLYAGQDFVAPYYHRHKYDGTITNSIVYPLTRALYGLRVRQPVGGDFGISARLVQRYLSRSDWETDVAHFGIDIWLTTIAIAEGFRVCQSFLGAKDHDVKDPADLSELLQQVVGSIFTLMEEFQPVWSKVRGSEPVDLFGFRYDVGLDPVAVNVERMIESFRRGSHDLHEIWALALDAHTLEEIRVLAQEADEVAFHFPDELWSRLLIEMACAYRRRPLDRPHLLRSLTPLYLARVAGFVIETRGLVSPEVDEKIERSCLTLERLKPLLISHWEADTSPQPESKSRRGLASAAFPAAQPAGTSAKL
jgi:glycosyltransferase involved in cell wall biosynthesis